MKTAITTILLTLITTLTYSQARFVINNNGFVVIDNSAFLVLDNSNPNALATLGTGGNIISENENDVIKWEIGTTTGTYVIPWATTPVSQGGTGVKIPLTINKTNAGVGAAAEFILSTYETSTDMNVPYPSGVTNMNSANPVVDESLWVVDRFWHIDARSYGTKPNVTLTINYDPAGNEVAGTNTLTPANLLAQRFNTGTGSWQSFLFGTNNSVNNRVTNIVISSADFFEDFILVEQTNPLPVELVSFEANCDDNKVNISWSTQTEINNDFFVVEKSYDAISFFDLVTVQGAGNSNSLLMYSAIDNNPATGTVYYRLKQVDFDGTTKYHQIVSTSCSGSESFLVNNIVLSNNNLGFSIAATQEEDVTIYFYDYRGRMISNKVQHIESGNNLIELNNLELTTGIYMLSIVGEKNNYSTKLMSKRD